MVESRSDVQALADTLRDRRLPPVNDWHPAHCGSIDIRIARNGGWYHEGRPIHRKPLYRLFSTVLRRDEDGEYYLVTPVEKLRIQVDDAPFQAVALEVQGSGPAQRLIFTTNCDDRFVCGADHPLRVHIDAKTNQPSPYVLVRDRLEALIARAVYYELVELTQLRGDELGVWSGGSYFVLGSAAD